MVSMTMTVAIMAVAATCFVIVAHANMGGKCHFDTETLTEEEQKLIAECYTEVTGKQMNQDSGKELSDADKEKMGNCVSEKMGANIGTDGKFNADEAKAQVARIQTDDETKEAIIDGIDSCATTGGELKTIQKCMKKVVEKECQL